MNTIPFDLPGFVIDRVYSLEDALTIYARAVTLSAPCPTCYHTSAHVHSYYTRTVKDLAVGQKAVRLVLRVRRFRCNDVVCPRRTFGERLPAVVGVYAQRTTRLSTTLQLFADNISAQLAAHLLRKMRIAVSPDTLLRIAKRPGEPITTAPRVLGVDDFAFRRGHHYGTILVNLETHQPIDLLPDRTATTLATWLKAHPGSTIISRDRSPEYAKGITAGAPNAQQVADRWHILRNWRDMVERLLHTRYPHLLARLKAAGHPVRRRPTRKRSVAERAAKHTTQTRRHLRYTDVRQRHADGQTMLAIAGALHMSRSTVRKYLNLSTPPPPIEHRPQPSALRPYHPYLEKQWAAGCRNAKQLWRDVQAHGFTGGYKGVQRWVALYRDQPGRTLSAHEKARAAVLTAIGAEDRATPPPPAPGTLPPDGTLLPKPRSLVWLFLKRPETLTETERTWWHWLETDPELQRVAQLSRTFVALVQERRAEGLAAWITECAASEIGPCQTFAAGIQREFSSISAGLALRWSNGPVEGEVNKLKNIKRSMYGRGSFALLRNRVLRAA